jgi:hypothetical protein
VFNFTAVLYFFSLLAWVWNNPRFLYPIQPQLLTGLLIGVEGLLIFMFVIVQRLLRPKASSSSTISFTKRLGMNPLYYLAAFIAILFLASIYKSLTIADSRVHVGLLAERTQWIKENTPSDIIFASEYPVIDYLIADRRSIQLQNIHNDIVKMQEFLVKNRVDYILVAPKLVWMQPRFVPQNSELMASLLPAFKQLQSDGVLQVTFSRPQQGISVYKVLR